MCISTWLRLATVLTPHSRNSLAIAYGAYCIFADGKVERTISKYKITAFSKIRHIYLLLCHSRSEVAGEQHRMRKRHHKCLRDGTAARHRCHTITWNEIYMQNYFWKSAQFSFNCFHCFCRASGHCKSYDQFSNLFLAGPKPYAIHSNSHSNAKHHKAISILNRLRMKHTT